MNIMLCPINNLTHLLFKHINVKYNGTLFTENVDMYHYKSYVQALFNYDRNDGDTILRAQGWRNGINPPDTFTAASVKMDDAAFTGASKSRQETITNMKEDAREFFISGKRALMRMKPFVDIFNQGRWIIPRTSLDLEFYLNPIKLVFDREKGMPTEVPREFQTEDLKLSLNLCLVSLNPTTSVDFMKRLNKTKANGKVPQRIVIGVVRAAAFNGAYEHDPYAFEKAGVEYIKQIVNGEEYPYERIELKSDSGERYLAQYQRFCDATGCLYRNHGNMVRFDDWGEDKNYTLFVFSNVAHGRHDEATLLPRNEAFINIQIKAAAQVEQKTIIIYAEYEGMVEIRSIKEALVAALIAGGKALGLGALSGAAGFGAKKALDSATRRRRRGRR
ncbi:hypothetical protein AWC38_SpisGene20062 [Stylophora pistillata]|uniref:Uncharacterized protein n=1 Tax=Stylophora pistillata TaxID=50429 RepID=A0A2B4RHI0_STYPI|nr:hypothetical protein AWC38_SpisGene20062 [Stylophora pistillata]